MKLKGAYDSATEYSVGDVVKYTDGNVYHLINPAPTGTPPTDTLYWGQVDQQHQKAAVLFALDVLELAMGAFDALEERVAALEPEPDPDDDDT